jgi:predicted transcriptional regulator
MRLLGPLEGRIMKEVWSGKISSPFVVWDVNDRMSELAYTTVMTTVVRLADKGLLRAQRVSGQRAVLYHLAGTPQQFLHQASRAQVEELVSLFGDTALAAFEARLDRLDPEQRRRLRELADQ